VLVVAGQSFELKEPRAEVIPSDMRVHGDTTGWPGCLDFAVNVVPGGPPDWLREELRTALDRSTSYPDERDALQALAERHGRPSEEILPLNGSAEAFWLLARTLRPRRVVVVHPSFSEPEVALRTGGRRVERVFRDSHDFSLAPGTVPADADLVFVCNPNNPTGTLDRAEKLERMARPGRVLVVDEAFMEFSPGEPESLAGRRDIPGLIIVRSLTKVWSLPGIRAGYLLASPRMVAALKAARQPWSVNALALAALTTCAQDEATPRKIAEETAAARDEFAADLTGLRGVQVWPSAANFLLLRVPDGASAREALAARGIAVRRADSFPGLTPDHLRIAVRRPEENQILVEALRETLS
jgi:histidinol-phosphate aminotransferase